jgi:O-antigen/teichoic acid export membrane protein
VSRERRPDPASRPSPLAAARALAARAPLLFNGYSLIANAGITSVLGLLFWMLATRVYTPEVVGLGAALITVMMNIGYLAQMNLGSALTRFLPAAGRRAPRLVLGAYAVVAAVAVVVSALFAVFAGHLAEPLLVLREHPTALVWFVAASVVWTIFALEDSVLAGLRRAVVVPLANTIYSIAKIALIGAFALVAIPVPGPVFLAATLPLIPIVLVVTVFILRETTRPGAVAGSLPDLATLRRFVGWDYIGSIAIAGAFTLAPLMVMTTSGIAENATYALAWQLAYSVYLVGRSLSTSLVAEGARDPGRLVALEADTLVHSMVVAVPAAIVLAAAAPLVMMIFGPAYTDTGPLTLQLLSLANVPWVATTIHLAAERVRGRTRSVAVIQVATLVLFAAVWWLGPGGEGAAGVAFAWFSAHGLVLIGIVAADVRRHGRAGIVDRGLAIGSALARLVAAVAGLIRRDGTETVDAAARIVGAVDHPRLSGVKPVRGPRSLSDGTAVLLVDAAAAAEGRREVRAVLKCAVSGPGIAALRRNETVLRRLEADDRLGDDRALLPVVLDRGRRGTLSWIIESAVPGTAGGALFATSDADAVLPAVLDVIGSMHRRTAVPRSLDEAWIRHWIDRPLSGATVGVRGLTDGVTRGRMLEAVAATLRGHYGGRRSLLGLGHGDLSPGNVLFSADPSAGGAPRLTGIVDWDGARFDAPAGVDAAHLLMTARAARRGCELGTVVVELLAEGDFAPAERAVLEAAYGERAGWIADPRERRAMMLLAWFHHVASNLSKSERYGASRLWMAANVDRVLAAIDRNTFGK